MAFWLVVGPPQNWEHSLNHGNIWGFPKHYSSKWEQIEVGDTIVYYAMRPVKGLIGYGTLESKMLGEKPFFPSETEQNRVLWPLRITYRNIFSLSYERWPSSGIPLERRGVILQRAVHRLQEERGKELVQALSSLRDSNTR